MKKKLTCMILAVACVVLLAAGCATFDPQKATLALPANPSTGYEWSAVQEGKIFDIESEYVPDENTEGLVGVGGTETFTITPKKEGKATITFTYARPGQEDEAEARLTYTLKSDFAKQISVESFSSDVAGDMSTVPEIPEIEIGY